MKNVLKISLPIFLFSLLILDIGLQLREEKVDLLVLTGKKEGVNPMLSTWAKNEPFFSYSASKGFPLEGKTVNSYSFISTPEISLIKDTSTTRIAFLGGSSTAGTGQLLKDEETWPWKVVQDLKAANLKVDFINGAASGYTTFESYGLLWSKLRFFNPDIVIVNHGWNDYAYFNKSKEQLLQLRKNEYGIYEGINFEMLYETYTPTGLDRFITFSQLLSRLRLMVWNKPGRGEVNPFIDSTPVTLQDEKAALFGDEAFLGNLKLIAAFCELRGIACFFCLQPTLVLGKNLEPVMAAESERVQYIKKDLDGYLMIYEAIKKVAPKSNIIDLTSVCFEEGNFIDYIHPSPKGTSSIAQIVKDSLILNYFNPK